MCMFFRENMQICLTLIYRLTKIYAHEITPCINQTWETSFRDDPHRANIMILWFNIGPYTHTYKFLKKIKNK